MPDRNKMASILICIAIGLAYVNTLSAEPVFDDLPILRAVERHSHESICIWLRSLIKWRGADRPLLFLSYRLDHRIFGQKLTGWHWTNIVIHATNSLLIYAILLHFYSTQGALLGSLVFAVHPLATSGVSCIAGRSSSLSAIFYFAAILAAVSGHWLLTIPLGWLSWKCKEDAVLLPAALLGLWLVT